MSKVIIDWIGGNCPVQAEGKISDEPFYFRARGEHWRVDIGKDPVIWSYEQEYPGGDFAAGWMTEAEARQFIDEAAERYLNAESRTMRDTG